MDRDGSYCIKRRFRSSGTNKNLWIKSSMSLTHNKIALFPLFFSCGFRSFIKASIGFKVLLFIHCQTLQMWEPVLHQGLPLSGEM